MEHHNVRTEAGGGMRRAGGRRCRHAPASPRKPQCMTPAPSPPRRAAPWSVGASELLPRSGGDARLHAVERPLAPCMLMSSAGRAAPINCWKYLLTYQMGSRGAKLEGRVS